MPLGLTGWIRNFRKTKSNATSPLGKLAASQLTKLFDIFGEGEQARRVGNRDKALHLYGEALALLDSISVEIASSLHGPRSVSEAYAQLGRVFGDLSDATNSEIAFRKAIEIDNTYDMSHYFLELLLQRNSKREIASASYFNGLVLTNNPLFRQALEDLDYSPTEIYEALKAGFLPKTPVVPDDADFASRPVEALSEKVKSYYWFHSINLGGGIVTPGTKTRADISREAEAIFNLVSLEGRSVVDIGAWNGGFTVEAKRRGAGRLLAVDDYSWTHPELRGKETFDLVMSRLGIDAETKQIDVVDVSVEKIGRWQVTLFLGVFYHLLDPIVALQRLATITEEVLILETHLELRDLDRPAMAFFPNCELNGDATNWWAPNAPAVEAMLKVFGFEKVLTTPNPVSHSVRGIFHAFKTQAIYDEHKRQIAQRKRS